MNWISRRSKTSLWDRRRCHRPRFRRMASNLASGCRAGRRLARCRSNAAKLRIEGARPAMARSGRRRILVVARHEVDCLHAARESRAWNISVVPGRGGEPVNVTRLYAQHSQPAWSPDGKYLFFQSNRDGDGFYVLPLTQRRRPQLTTRTSSSRSPRMNVAVKIEFEDISRRIRKVSSQARSRPHRHRRRLDPVHRRRRCLVRQLRRQGNQEDSPPAAANSSLRVSPRMARKPSTSRTGNFTTMALRERSREGHFHRGMGTRHPGRTPGRVHAILALVPSRVLRRQFSWPRLGRNPAADTNRCWMRSKPTTSLPRLLQMHGWGIGSFALGGHASRQVERDRAQSRRTRIHL